VVVVVMMMMVVMACGDGDDTGDAGDDGVDGDGGGGDGDGDDVVMVMVIAARFMVLLLHYEQLFATGSAVSQPMMWQESSVHWQGDGGAWRDQQPCGAGVVWGCRCAAGLLEEMVVLRLRAAAAAAAASRRWSRSCAPSSSAWHALAFPWRALM
jgi:hypothetical protein